MKCNYKSYEERKEAEKKINARAKFFTELQCIILWLVLFSIGRKYSYILRSGSNIEKAFFIVLGIIGLVLCIHFTYSTITHMEEYSRLIKSVDSLCNDLEKEKGRVEYWKARAEKTEHDINGKKD